MRGARRFFSQFVTPDMFVEHPPEMPLNEKDIPLGPIEGWDVFAPPYHGDPNRITGPFKAVVVEKYGRKCIEVKHDDEAMTEFWYNDGKGVELCYPNRLYYPNRPCWYQSSCTLRFIRPRKVS